MANRSSSDYPQLRILTRLSQVLWTVARIPALALLVVLEPLASTLLAGAALLCFLMAFFFKWTGADPASRSGVCFSLSRAGACAASL